MAECDDSREVSGALAALLELEDDVARRISQARVSAELTVSEAHAAVERVRANRAEELDEAVRILRARLASAHRAALATIEDRARTEVQRFDALSGETTASLADALVEELVKRVVPKEPAR